MNTFADWLKPELIWFIIGFVLLLLEFTAPGLILFFFGVGAWIVSIICFFFGIAINLQLLIFLSSSILLLLLLRKRLKTTFFGRIGAKGSSFDDEIDHFIGEKCVVTKAVTKNVNGRVEFRGTAWNADADEDIPEGTAARIVSKDNITLKIKKLEEG